MQTWVGSLLLVGCCDGEDCSTPERDVRRRLGRSDEPRREGSPFEIARGLVLLEHCASGVTQFGRDALRGVLRGFGSMRRNSGVAGGYVLLVEVTRSGTT